MPQFNASSALLFKRFVESGVTSREELSNVMGNASVDLNPPFKKYVEVNVMQAIQTPLAQSSQEAAVHLQNQAQQQTQAQAQQQQQAQEQQAQQAGPAMHR